MVSVVHTQVILDIGATPLQSVQHLMEWIVAQITAIVGIGNLPNHILDAHVHRRPAGAIPATPYSFYSPRHTLIYHSLSEEHLIHLTIRIASHGLWAEQCDANYTSCGSVLIIRKKQYGRGGSDTLPMLTPMGPFRCLGGF